MRSRVKTHHNQHIRLVLALVDFDLKKQEVKSDRLQNLAIAVCRTTLSLGLGLPSLMSESLYAKREEQGIIVTETMTLCE